MGVDRGPDGLGDTAQGGDQDHQRGERASSQEEGLVGGELRGDGALSEPESPAPSSGKDPSALISNIPGTEGRTPSATRADKQLKHSDVMRLTHECNNLVSETVQSLFNHCESLVAPYYWKLLVARKVF